MLEITGRRDGQAKVVSVYCKVLPPNPQLTLLSYSFAYEDKRDAGGLSVPSQQSLLPFNHVMGFLACLLLMSSPLIQSTEELFSLTCLGRSTLSLRGKCLSRE